MKKVQPQFDAESGPFDRFWSSRSAFKTVDGLSGGHDELASLIRVSGRDLLAFQRSIIEWTLQAVNRSLPKDLRFVLGHSYEDAMPLFEKVKQLQVELMHQFSWGIGHNEFHELVESEKEKGRQYLRKKFGNNLRAQNLINEIFREPRIPRK
jgi:hypothetical protein